MRGTKALLFTPIRALSLDVLVPADHFYLYLDRILDHSIARPLPGLLHRRRGAPICRSSSLFLSHLGDVFRPHRGSDRRQTPS